MSNLPLWKRCRILANPLRLKLLIYLLEQSEQYVKVTADEFGIAEDVASKNLQLLASGGFLSCEPVSKYLYYKLTKPDPLLRAVLNELQAQRVDLRAMAYTLTALTHERRVLMVALLQKEPMVLDHLCDMAKISKQAGERHVNKLVRRGWVGLDNDAYTLLQPKDKLGRVMIACIKNDPTLAQVWENEQKGTH